MSEDNIKIIVATHKKYRMPRDSIYLPLQVGATGKPSIGYKTDNTGINISIKNANYCELTGLYWAWKNEMADVLGLVHYRRYFTVKKTKEKWDCIASEEQIRNVLEQESIVLPKKRNYLIETNYSQYAHAHHAVDLDITRQIIIEKYPEYLFAFDLNMKRVSGHRFNMFIMSKNYIDEYCTWLFDILFELENRLDISTYSANDARVFGFVSERLLDVWLDTKQYKYVELPVVFMENEHWLLKGTRFIKRKILSSKK